MAEEKTKKYTAEEIKVLEGLEGIRMRYDVVELSRRIKKRRDILIIANELKIKPRALKSAVEEGRILALFPKIYKSKAGILARLRTNKELNLFSQKYDIFSIPVRKLRILVKNWNQELQNNPFMLITQQQHNMIIGTLFGDSSIRQRQKNSCFRFTHSIKQKSYAELKKEILRDFQISEFREVKRRIKNTFIHAIDFATKTHPIFNYYRNLFYKNGRKTITKEILEQLTPESLAFWVCDDGSYDNTQGYIVLCTNAYSLEEHKLMKQFFKEKFDLDTTIGFRDNKYYYLRFKQEDSKKLIELIKPFISKCMKYKIGEQNE